MLIYGLKTCDTCRKAQAALPGARLVDLRDDPMPDAVRRAALDPFGAALVNTRSTTWRGLDEAQRGGDPAQLLADHPALMKRPLIVTDAGEMHLGWTPQVRSALGAGGGGA